MTIRQFQRWTRRAMLGGGVAAGLLLGCAGAGPLAAQAPPLAKYSTQPAAPPQAAPVQRNFLNKQVIKLPIEMDQQVRQLIREIHLYAKDHPSAPWTLCDKVGPAQDSFTFQAPRDGEYWFTMATIDKQGRSVPADLRNEPPGLAVVIDTQPPTIQLKYLGDTPIGQLIQCEMRDLNLDQGKSRLFFQGGDQVFRDMLRVPGRANVFCIPAEAVCTGLIRASAEDLAGNHGFVEAHLSAMKGLKLAPAGAGPTAPPQEKVIVAEIQARPQENTPAHQTFPRPLPRHVATGPEVITMNVNSAPQPPVTPRSVPFAKAEFRPDGTDGPRWIGHQDKLPQGPANPPAVDAKPTHTAARQPAANVPSRLQVVNTNKVFLDYQIENAGFSGVAKVEVWITRDKGESWIKIGEDRQRKGPLEVQLSGDGLFGVTLVASNGRGISGAPPRKGDAPDGWIEVDTTKPLAQITSVHCGPRDGKMVVDIAWTAQDKNLTDAPVDLFYAATPQGPWLPIALGLKGEGQHCWAPPAAIGPQAHLRLIAKDAAGNTAIASTTEPVQFDDPARPRAVIRTIRTTASEAPAPPPAQPVRITPAPVSPPAPLQIIQPPPIR